MIIYAQQLVLINKDKQIEADLNTLWGKNTMSIP